jgi:catechol 2,3-dioxygenase-like lactoylglutathione lyase family enzyme
MDLRLELVVLPVSDVDRTKAFYVDQLGFHADHDHVVTPELRFVQLTPPGSACSIAFGIGLTDAAPGSVKGLQVVTTDIEETQRELRDRGLDTGGIDDLAWGRFLHVEDPDGNQWAIQQIVRPNS